MVVIEVVTIVVTELVIEVVGLVDHPIDITTRAVRWKGGVRRKAASRVGGDDRALPRSLFGMASSAAATSATATASVAELASVEADRTAEAGAGLGWLMLRPSSRRSVRRKALPLPLPLRRTGCERDTAPSAAGKKKGGGGDTVASASCDPGGKRERASSECVI